MSFSETTEKTVDFRGRAGEWFGIWIVNLLLSIITIGIYSAWAKVRRLKYFYNNTYVDDRNFDYHATGGQILIGRLIFIAGYVVFSLILQVAPPVLVLIMMLALFAFLPWLLVRAMRFNARMTSFSNVRFDFQGSYGRALVVFILVPLAIYIALFAIGTGGFLMVGSTLGISGTPSVTAFIPLIILMLVVFPVIFAVYDRMLKRFSINNHLLGDAPFALDISLRPFLIAQAAAVAWVVVVGGIGVVVTGFSFAAMIDSFEALERGAPPGPVFGMIGLFYFIFFLAFIPAGFIYQALTRNAVYGHSSLQGGHVFRSDINPFMYFWIGLSNFVIAVVSLGLMLPWCQIRLMKYLSDHTHVTPGGSLDDFVGEQIEAGNAIGDAYGDFEAVDIGLPI